MALNIDELNGRALDAAVARHVFGYQVEERSNPWTREPDVVYNGELEAGRGPAWVRVPFYSRSFDASIYVVIELQRRGWKLREAPAGEPSDARVVFEHADGRTVEASGSEDEALCRAALKAVSR
jgi:hypothetical protein